ncbi:glycosyltransferase family 2 protein [Psychrobacter okhotskensis]|uniref:glycosyltransferase family 2 protein n=1 Tax=Psychrobacter okhotskensis TaxID=212403 RepID=UPI001D114467|nr:glycosyltransferase family A protein [Psychrobacter okhotskensis]
MNKTIFISIGIPFYNAESYLEDAICSVLAQTYSYWELILIDDGSTDRSLEIANQYAAADERIRVVSDGKNKRLATRLNQIIRESKYEYIARMDADDLMSNNRLKLQLQVLEKNKRIDLVTTGCLTIGKDNELTGVRRGKNYQMSAATILEGGTNLLHASLLARKSWYLRNQYNEKRVIAQDFELWLQAAKNNDLKYIVIEDPLYWYRVTENVTIEKLHKGYSTQIEVISNNYDGVITKKKNKQIVRKFKVKKAIAKTLSKLRLLKILLHLRSGKYDQQDLMYYKENIIKIKEARI